MTRRYGRTTAVDGVSFEVRDGEAFGLLGPNGAGKTTTLHMLVGALGPDAGSVEIAGQMDPRRPEVRKRLGLAPQALAIYDDLSAQENLGFFGQLYGMRGAELKERVDWALSLAGLTDRRKHLAKTFSGGMKRRLNLACALVHDPPVLLLDEPTVGVDPQSRNHIFDCIDSLRAEGRTVLYTTHYMEEAERLCDRVAIMDRGKILALDTVSNLISAHGGESILEVELAGALAEPVSGFTNVEDDKLLIATREPHTELARLAAAGGEVSGLALQRPSLQSVFLTLTGRSLRDE